MRAGPRRHRVVIERYSTVQGSFGENVETWTPLKTVWASIVPVAGAERTQGGKVDALESHIMNLRHTDITPKDRITKGVRIFNIVSVKNREEKNKEIELGVTEDV